MQCRHGCSWDGASLPSSAEQHHAAAACIPQSFYCHHYCVLSAVHDGYAFIAVCMRLCNLQISRYSMTRLQSQHSNMQESPSFASRAEGAPQQPSVRNSGLSLQVPSHDESPCGSMLHSSAQSHGPVAVESTRSCLLHAAPSSNPAQAERGGSQQTTMPGRIEPSALAASGMQMQVGLCLVHQLRFLQIMQMLPGCIQTSVCLITCMLKQ